MSKRIRFFSAQTMAIAIILLLLLLYPLETIVAPSWEVTVVAADEHPMAGVFVRETWQNYSLESESHEEDLYTNADGKVVFSRRTIRSSTIWRILGPVRSAFATGIHASFGPSASIIAMGGGLEGWADCAPCQTNAMHSRIVMRRLVR